MTRALYIYTEVPDTIDIASFQRSLPILPQTRTQVGHIQPPSPKIPSLGIPTHLEHTPLILQACRTLNA